MDYVDKYYYDKGLSEEEMFKQTFRHGRPHYDSNKIPVVSSFNCGGSRYINNDLIYIGGEKRVKNIETKQLKKCSVNRLRRLAIWKLKSSRKNMIITQNK